MPFEADYEREDARLLAPALSRVAGRQVGPDEAAWFWAWRSEEVCAGWLLLSDDIEAEARPYWRRWVGPGRPMLE